MSIEHFNSAAKLGVPQAYNNRQYSQIFAGIEQEIEQVSGDLNDKITTLAISGSSGLAPVIIASGSTPPAGTVDGQIAFFQNSSGEYFEYSWISGAWTVIKTSTEDVTLSGSAPLGPESTGLGLDNQVEANQYLFSGIETNTAAIATNSGAIANNVQNIALNAQSIQANAVNIEANAAAISGNTADIAAIQASGATDTTYRIETDAFVDPQIQLVDNEGGFTNVKLTGKDGIVTSTKSLNELEFSASGLVEDGGYNYSSYLTFNGNNGGIKINRDTTLYMTQFSPSLDQVRFRMQSGREFKFTAYLNSSPSTETTFMYWNPQKGLELFNLEKANNDLMPVREREFAASNASIGGSILALQAAIDALDARVTALGG